jgi:hypothetical protein
MVRFYQIQSLGMPKNTPWDDQVQLTPWVLARCSYGGRVEIMLPGEPLEVPVTAYEVCPGGCERTGIRITLIRGGGLERVVVADPTTHGNPSLSRYRRDGGVVADYYYTFHFNHPSSYHHVVVEFPATTRRLL